MNRNRNVECECPVVHHIDSEEQHGTDTPFPKWNWGRLNKEAACGIKLIVQGRQTGEDELEERDKKATVGFVSLRC